MDTEPTILCPIKGPLPVPSCPADELAPLLEMLYSNQTVSEPRKFPRGTLLPDGRLDLCKQSLGIDGCLAVTAALADNTFVKSLLLGTNGIGDAGAAAVAGLLAVNRTLEVVYLGCNGIRAEGTERLACSVAANPTVTGLWLKRNPVGAGGVQAIARLLHECRSLRVLDLVNTCPGDPALGAIITTLSRHPHAVESLYLSGNSLDASWGVPLASLVTENMTLHGLFLSVNCLEDEGAISLATGLANNRELRALSVASNGLGPAGVAAIARSLTAHPHLTWLDLGYSPSTRVLGCTANRVAGFAIAALAELLVGTPRLAEVNLTGTGIDHAGLQVLSHAVKQNPTVMNVMYSGLRFLGLEELLAERRTAQNWTPPPRPDVALIKSVYR